MLLLAVRHELGPGGTSEGAARVVAGIALVNLAQDTCVNIRTQNAVNRSNIVVAVRNT